MDTRHWNPPTLAHGADNPIWFNVSQEMALYLNASEPEEGKLVIGSPTNVLTIIKPDPFQSLGDLVWLVKWTINHGPNFAVEGRTVFSDEDLQAAFCLIDHVDRDSGWLIHHFGGNSARQGAFLRWKRFLNIPNPDLGRFFATNVSIEVTEEIQRAVATLLERNWIKEKPKPVTA